MLQRGFTLLEVLMALTIFSLIAALAYGALGTAGEGFKRLAEVRDVQEKSAWVGRQLRSDVMYISSSSYQQLVSSSQQSRPVPLRIVNDNRGDTEFDELWLLVREPGMPGISEVRYFIDEDKGHLMRQSRLLWARDDTEPVLWDMGKASSWAVEVLAEDGRWQQDWHTQQVKNAALQIKLLWPLALRIRMQNQQGQREWLLAIEYGLDL